jgi:Cu(I)/Ag(I) efflux system periplasmic protein CusF
MKILNALIQVTVFALTSAPSFGVIAQANTDQGKMSDMKMEQSTAMTDMADGEVRKIDKDARKITITHGEIKNLEMPAMTMVFQIKDPAMLEKVQTGDKVKFKAEKSGGAMVVTEIQVSK